MSERDVDGTILRVVRLLRELAAVRDGVALGDLADRLSLPASTLHRLLQRLAAEGLAERSAEGGRYRAGREFYRIAALVVGNNALGRIAAPVLESLGRRCAETCVFAVYLPAARRLTVVAHVRSSHALRYDVDELIRESLLRDALGRAMLAFLPAPERAAILAEAAPVPDGTLRDELAQARRDGFLLTRRQRIPDSVGFGAPVFEAGGGVLGGLSITIPELRFDPAARDALGALLLDHARRLGAALGHGPAGACHA